jgi:hypothetical protein
MSSLNLNPADLMYVFSEPVQGGNTFARFFYCFEEIELLERARVLDLIRIPLRLDRPTAHDTEEENAAAFYAAFQHRCRAMELSGMFEPAVVYCVVCQMHTLQTPT